MTFVGGGDEVNRYKRKTPQNMAFGGVIVFVAELCCDVPGGDEGIRTLDAGLCPHAPLAGECLRPLGHVS